ncbi:MAG: hypothetical protein RIR11_5121 [Bacteroidota bacterium]
MGQIGHIGRCPMQDMSPFQGLDGCRIGWCRIGWCRIGWCHIGWCRIGWCRIGWCCIGWCCIGWCRIGWCRIGWCRIGRCRIGRCRIGRCPMLDMSPFQGLDGRAAYFRMPIFCMTWPLSTCSFWDMMSMRFNIS